MKNHSRKTARNPYKCPTCLKFFKSEQVLENHIGLCSQLSCQESTSHQEIPSSSDLPTMADQKAFDISHRYHPTSDIEYHSEETPHLSQIQESSLHRKIPSSSD